MRRLIALSVVASIIALAPIASAQATRPSDSPSANPTAGMARKLPELKLNGVPLADAIDFLRDVSGLNIHVNWRALELLNVTKQTPVNLQFRSVSAGVVLRTLVNELGQGTITYFIEDGVVEVTTTEIADSKVYTRVYPVDDLVMEIPNFAGPTFNLQQQSNTASGGGGGGSSSQSLFGGSGQTVVEQTASKQQRGDALVKLITDTVRPDIWRENGGTATIRFFNGHLIVTAPRSVHESIGGSFK